MDDVARLAGVSLKSVSRVINAEPHVSARLRERVDAAIAALN
ncbi:MAG: LacI family DNA-binding transcriptional regulator, partial [Novosphingobium sp.]